MKSYTLLTKNYYKNLRNACTTAMMLAMTVSTLSAMPATTINNVMNANAVQLEQPVVNEKELAAPDKIGHDFVVSVNDDDNNYDVIFADNKNNTNDLDNLDIDANRLLVSNQSTNDIADIKAEYIVGVNDIKDVEEIIIDYTPEREVVEITTPPATEPVKVETVVQETVSTEPIEPVEATPAATEPIVSPTVTESENDVSNTEPETNNDDVVYFPIFDSHDHDYQYYNTEVDNSYEIYNEVTTYYKCTKCDAMQAESKREKANANLSGIAYDIIWYVNDLRASNGLNTLWCGNGTFDSFANTRAYELSYCFGHNRPGGAVNTTTDGTYYVFTENVNSGGCSAYEIYRDFYNSGTHRNAMLLADAVGIAVGVYVSDDGIAYTQMSIIFAY